MELSVCQFVYFQFNIKKKEREKRRRTNGQARQKNLSYLSFFQEQFGKTLSYFSFFEKNRGTRPNWWFSLSSPVSLFIRPFPRASRPGWYQASCRARPKGRWARAIYRAGGGRGKPDIVGPDGSAIQAGHLGRNKKAGVRESSYQLVRCGLCAWEQNSRFGSCGPAQCPCLWGLPKQNGRKTRGSMVPWSYRFRICHTSHECVELGGP